MGIRPTPTTPIAFGAPDGEAVSNTVPAELNVSGGTLATYAFPTTITNALGQAVLRKYDYYLGHVVDAADVNGVVTSLYDNDLLDRLTKAVRDAGSSGLKATTTFIYDDVNLVITQNSDLAAPGDGLIQTQTLFDPFDPLGRKVETREYTPTNVLDTSPASYDAYISTQTKYDGLHRVFAVSNPTAEQVSAPAVPAFWTQTTYDGLSRTLTFITTADNAVSSNSYLGNRATTADPACKVRTVKKDALGRLTQVQEDPASPAPAVYSACSQNPVPPTPVNSTTTYAYDVLSNLLTVNQGVQTRTFTYDSLSRLQTAANPETGGPSGYSTSYHYDSNGNLTEKDTPNSNATLYNYDKLNRVTSKTFSGPLAGATPPNVISCYDGATTAFGCGAAPAGPNMVGRMTMVQNPYSTSLYSSYDTLGRVTGSSQQTVGMVSPYPVFSYGYNLADAMISTTLPSGRIVNYTYDQANRVLSAAPSQATVEGLTAYASAVTYAPQGAINYIQLGNGLWETTAFNNRLQPTVMSLLSNSGSLWTLQNSYGLSATQDNGNITSQALTLPGSQGAVAITTAYAYDGANRLLVASAQPSNPNSPVCPDSNSQWCQLFQYDIFGNRSMAQQGGIGQSPLAPTSFNTAANQANNQVSGVGWTYDTTNQRGTLLGDPGFGVYSYDAEDRMISANGTMYAYDGDGRRVMKIPPGGTTSSQAWYVYDAMGQLAAEYGNSTPSEAGTVFLTGDHLGTTRVVTNMANPTTPVERHDFMPFGEEISITPASPQYTVAGYAPAVSVPLLFTGKERDAETGLDYFGARYLSSNMGRWMSPDPSNWGVDFYNPQTWNHYSYVGNNPLSNTDPNGLWLTPTHNSIIDRGLPGLSKEQRQILKDVSKHVDDDQSQEGSFKHGMTSEDNDPEGPNGMWNPKYDTDDWIEQNEHNAKEIQADWIASGHTGISPAALAAFGNAAHTITDSYSPAHAGYQKVNHWTITWHVLRETTLFGGHKKEQQQAIGALQTAFYDVFGSAAGDQATHEKVTSRIVDSTPFPPDKKQQ
jgi:RHS repeat-associated protein